MIQLPEKPALIPREAIILAGGKGERLKSISGNTPKPMMPVCGKPFIYYLLHKLRDSGVTRAILSLGYSPEVFRAYLGIDFHGMSLDYCIENTPLGTGGAIGKALACSKHENLLIVNGDSYFNIDIPSLFAYHVKLDSDITIALKQIEDCSRYGSVTCNHNRIVGFREKGDSGKGYINGGIYIVNRRISGLIPENRFFSFERELLVKQIGKLMIHPYISTGYFIDIGIPEDYQRAQSELPGQVGATE